MATEFENLVRQLYQEQLGREAEAEGLAFWANALASGASAQDIAREIGQSLEGQNFDTQYITSLYRQNLARNPEQAGFQWWLSVAQDAGYTPTQLNEMFQTVDDVEQVARGIQGQTFTDMQLASLEADPYGGRYATQSIYDLLPDAVNVSRIGNRQAQFVSPVTQQPVITGFGGGQEWTEGQGVDVLNAPAVQAAVQRALNSGALTDAQYRSLYKNLENAKSMDDVYAAFNTPQAQVVVDALYGQQIGEAATLAQARAEAAQRQAVLDANNLGYYQSNPQLAQLYADAGLYYPFGPEAFTGYDTRTGQANVVTNENFNQQLNNALTQLYGRFGGAQDMATPLTGQYYSETGLQPGYTPIGGQGTMFRSGVAGYTPNLPSMFQFGMPPVDTSFQQYSPGAFQPEGVTTGGFITGYTQDGQPIYSTLANPNVNVPVMSEVNAARSAWETGPITEQNFDAQAYIRNNPDYATSGFSSPYQHYLAANRLGDTRTATRLPFNQANYVQTSQLNTYNPAANATSQFFIAPNGQVFASEQAYNATQSYSGG